MRGANATAPASAASECGAPMLTHASFHSDGWAVEMPVRLSAAASPIG
jgi:hypothetical protein